MRQVARYITSFILLYVSETGEVMLRRIVEVRVHPSYL